MPQVSEVIRHLLRHVDAEAERRAAQSPRDPAPQRRAAYLRETVLGLVGDDRDLGRDDIKALVRLAAPPGALEGSFLRMWDNATEVNEYAVGWIRRESELG